MERKFVVAEIVDCHSKLKEITESELKRRFRITVDKWKYDRPWEMILTILLNGDGEKGEERKYPCSDCGKLLSAAEGGSTFTVCDECWDKGKVVPTPSPTRAEWEMFAHNFANAIYFRANEKTLAERILSMPIVPKE